MPEAVPIRFQVQGQRPTAVKSKCKICELPYTAHSGKSCVICKSAVEHHTTDAFEECYEGRRRMARARFMADVPLNEIDKLTLENG